MRVNKKCKIRLMSTALNSIEMDTKETDGTPRYVILFEQLWGSKDSFESFLALNGLKRNAMPLYRKFNTDFAQDIRRKIHKHLYHQMPYFPEDHFRLVLSKDTTEIEACFLSTIYSVLDSLVSILTEQGFGDVVKLNDYIRDTITVRTCAKRSFVNSVRDTRRVITHEVQNNENITKCLRLEFSIGSDKLMEKFFDTAKVRIKWNAKIIEYSDFSDILDLMAQDFWKGPNKIKKNNDDDDDGDDDSDLEFVS